MHDLFIIVKPEGTYLVNATLQDAVEMKAKGWTVHRIGSARYETMAGVLAGPLVIAPEFAANLDALRY